MIAVCFATHAGQHVSPALRVLSEALWQLLCRSQALQTSVASWIVGLPFSPHPKDYSHPRPPHDADGVRVIAASVPCSSVKVFRPPVAMARALGHGRKRAPQVFVARSAEASHLALARLYRNRTQPCSGGQRLVCWVALPPIADLGHQRGCRKRTVGAQKQ